MTPVDNTTPAEQRPSGRRWSEKTVEPKSMAPGSIPPTGDRGTCGSRERTRTDARTKTTANQRERRGETAGTVPAARSLAGMPSPIRLRLSPDGREDHVRWGGGGQETGERAMVLGMGACVGNARDERQDLPRCSTAPARYPIPGGGGSGWGGLPDQSSPAACQPRGGGRPVRGGGLPYWCGWERVVPTSRPVSSSTAAASPSTTSTKMAAPVTSAPATTPHSATTPI